MEARFDFFVLQLCTCNECIKSDSATMMFFIAPLFVLKCFKLFFVVRLLVCYLMCFMVLLQLFGASLACLQACNHYGKASQCMEITAFSYYL